MDTPGQATSAWPRIALRAAIAIAALAVVAAIVHWNSARLAYARAGDFCAATALGTSAREVTIRALDQSVQVRTDIEPGALVVRFEAWGPWDAVGECRMTVVDGYVSATRVVRL